MSIQIILDRAHYEVCPGEDVFQGVDADGNTIKIPYSEIAGHTVKTFIEKAKRKGWLNADGSTPIVKQEAPAPVENHSAYDWYGLS